MMDRDAAWREYVQKYEIEVPEDRVENELNFMRLDMKHRMQYDTLTGGRSHLFADAELDQQKDEMYETAYFEVKSDLVMKVLLKEHAFPVTQEELETEACAMADRQNATMEMIRMFFGEDLEMLRRDVRERKAKDWVLDIFNHDEERRLLRKEKIHARDSLTEQEREEMSARIADRILASRECQSAKTILLYRATRGEVRLKGLETALQKAGKRLAFPLCISDTEMIALIPGGEDSWKKGYFGIEEPIREKSLFVAPEDIDLVLCPCSVFDEKCNRMGMGAGFYDRYLARCREDACIAAVAFEVQKAQAVPTDAWDHPMDLVFTEKRVYG